MGKHKPSSMELQLAKLRTAIDDAKLHALQLREDALALEARAAAALAAQASLTAQHGPLPVTNRSAGRGSSAPPSSLARKASHTTVVQGFQAGSVPPRCRVHRKHISVDTLYQWQRKSQSPFQALKSFQASTAAQLDCSANDICWYYDSARYPRVTGDEGMSTHFGTPKCFEKFVLLYLCTIIDALGLLLRIKRLENSRAPLAAARITPLRNALHMDNVTGASPGVSRYADSTLEADAESHLRAYDPTKGTIAADARPRLHSREAATDTHVADDACSSCIPDSCEPPLSASTADCEGEEMVQLARQVLSSLLREHVQGMHPADASSLCMRLRAVVSRFAPKGSMRPIGREGSRARSLQRSVISISRAMDAALSSVECDLVPGPEEPSSPYFRAGIDCDLEGLNAELASVRANWLLARFLAFSCQSQSIHLIGMQASRLSEGGAFSQREEEQVKAYALLDMSFEQKQALARLWHTHAQRTSSLVSTRQHLAQQLALLPSFSGLEMPASREAMLRFAPDAHAHRFFEAASREGRQSQQAPLCAACSAEQPWHDALADVSTGEPRQPVPWTQALLGASMSTTLSAQQIIAGFRDVQARQMELRLWFADALHTIWTPRQWATYLTADMPFTPDTFKLAVTAANEVRYHTAIASINHGGSNLYNA